MNTIRPLSRGELTAIYRAAIRGVARGDYDNAIGYCNILIEAQFVVAGALINRGLARSCKGNYEGAVRDLTGACEQLKSSPLALALAYTNRGNCNRELGNYQVAIADCTQSIEIAAEKRHSERTLAYAYMNRSLTHSAEGEHEKAIEDCNKAVQFASLTTQEAKSFAYADLGAVYGAQGNFEKANDAFEIAFKVAGSDVRPKAWAYWKRGTVRQMQGNAEGAIADLTEAIQADPQFAAPYKTRSAMYRSISDAARSEADQQAVERLKLDPVGEPDLRTVKRGVQRRQLLIIVAAIILLIVILLQVLPPANVLPR